MVLCGGDSKRHQGQIDIWFGSILPGVCIAAPAHWQKWFPMKIVACDPEHPDARRIILRLSETLMEITGDTGGSSFDFDDVRHPRSVFVIGYDDCTPIACGALRPISDEIVELKRMYAERGTGSLVLQNLEERAIRMGYVKVWLSTRIANERAVRFYRTHGYQQIENFGKYAGRDISVCFGKPLGRSCQNPATRVGSLQFPAKHCR